MVYGEFGCHALSVTIKRLIDSFTTFFKLRCRNTKLPVETNTFYGSLGSDRCRFCPQDAVGDAFHYLFSCSYFGDGRSLLLKPYYGVNPSTLKMEELFNESGSNKLNLC